MSALDSGIQDGDDELKKAERLAARAARFSKNAPGKRIKELEQARASERQAFEQQGLITLGKTELDAAVDMRGTCERMCSAFEAENRDIRGEVHPFERGQNMRMDPEKAVAAYTRSDAGAGHGESAILPSDLRTPTTLIRTLDYLFSDIMSIPPANSGSRSIARKALGNSAGFIRDRTRAIRKEFAMQSTWGQNEAIASFERIARWHILCIRELQEETGTNSDMHIDSAELGRCFTSLRHQYNDRREETGLDLPCPNEPEFRAYMLIFDLANKSVSIPTAELPTAILDHPLVKLAWEIRKAAQRNFDSQKEGSKVNAELGSNLITRFIKLLKQAKVPFLLSCLVEVRLRDMRRSALRAMTRAYPRLKAEPVRLNEMGQVVERRMVLINTLDTILGCEEQEEEDAAFDDIEPLTKRPDDETVSVVSRFELEVFPDKIEPVGSLINMGAPFNDNRDAPYTRRWKSITDKRQGLAFVDIVNGKAGIHIGDVPVPTVSASTAATATSNFLAPSVSNGSPSAFSFNQPSKTPNKVTFGVSDLSTTPKAPPPVTSNSAFNFSVQNSLKPVKDVAPPAAPKTQASGSVFSDSIFGNRSSQMPPTPPISARPATGPQTSSTPKNSFTHPIESSASNNASSTQKIVAQEKPPAPTPSFFPSLPPSSTSTHLPRPPIPVVLTPSLATLPETAPPTLVVPPSTSAPPLSTPLTSAVDKSVTPAPKQSIADLEQQRAKQRALAPALRDLLIEEVIKSLLLSNESELQRVVRQRQAALDHAQAKTQRQLAIVKWSEATCNAILKNLVEEMTKAVILADIGLRIRLRHVVRYWRSWTREQIQTRLHASKEREQVLDRLSHMGIGQGPGSVAWNDGFPTPVTDNGSQFTDSLNDEFQADIALQQTERQRIHFLSPSTFFHVIARHVASKFPYFDDWSQTGRQDDSIELDLNTQASFRIVISSAADSATAPADDAERWLVSKLTKSDEEPYFEDDIHFDAEVLGRYDDLPDKCDVGLLILEAPLSTWNAENERLNSADAQDRMQQFFEITHNSSNRFTPGLLILTWKDEPLEDVLDRLDIEETVKSFEQVAILSLDSFSDLDARLNEVLEGLMPEIKQRQQVKLNISTILDRLHPLLSNLLNAMSYIVSDNSTSVEIAQTSFLCGLTAIQQVTEAISKIIGKVQISKTSTYDPLLLPSFEHPQAFEMTTLVEAITDYLNLDTFAGVSDIKLLLTPLHQAAMLHQALPIVDILQSVALLVLGEIADQCLHLEAYFEDPSDFITAFFESLSASYTEVIDQQTTLILRSQANAQAQIKYSNPVDRLPQITDASTPAKNLKRSYPDDENLPRSIDVQPSSQIKKKESKAAKNARLLKVMREVERTLGRGLGGDVSVEAS